jgi:hypothetical protein
MFLGFIIFLDTEEYNCNVFLGTETDVCTVNWWIYRANRGTYLFPYRRPNSLPTRPLLKCFESMRPLKCRHRYCPMPPTPSPDAAGPLHRLTPTSSAPPPNARCRHRLRPADVLRATPPPRPSWPTGTDNAPKLGPRPSTPAVCPELAVVGRPWLPQGFFSSLLWMWLNLDEIWDSIWLKLNKFDYVGIKLTKFDYVTLKFNKLRFSLTKFDYVRLKLTKFDYGRVKLTKLDLI